ncbi:bifunctional 4-hydroxy-2-oxoglutarate aldolase/2-dehydro-3-deoxy-phosphogluconate aldolase [Fulvivirga ulvae]|uniref:bifunctional 4-hydroxy-2-oxoglutarate aldolase/2-dehydro-3-deoxy-phosphogluconate aldolase n=1 Tax=Fulvivirga ulvae TaxID=2904245 RepID=UPI001F2F5B6E|nr:bifunctional 4-hydroxy-2-oxoglutarate aldolase/2-dehydro-3-deoxy-phosphogluconate aldolase [Fulvivirga ulvae]UII31621.1 bifunctional 4-hydroxy-2-oxoglutarate aldolase/2-dehydro-3-deoxy-phosphogluconate aldolase [Fulvivirga ulvae]
MARFSRIEVFKVMELTGMVPLFYHHDIERAKKALLACYKGGARVLEFTNRGDYAHEVFRELNKYAEESMPEMILGVGSVTDVGAASLYLQLGANFVVTPVLREDIAIACNRKKVLWSPGCGSLTEIAQAEELGCELVKLFPGGTYGPGFVSGIKGPQPWTSIMPTGGVAPTEENLKAWFDAGVTCVGIGSKLISKELLANNNYEELEKRVKDCLALINKIRD